MKTNRIITAGIAALACLAQASFAGLVFEQEQKIQGNGMDMTMKMKTFREGDMMRMEIGDMSTVIINTASGEIQTLVPGQKMAMKMNMAAMKKMQEQQAQAAPKAPADAVKVALTGKSETIAGYDAEEVTIDSPQMSGRMWVARDFPRPTK